MIKIKGSVEYYLWRVLYVGIKPSAVIISYYLLGSEIANILSFSMLISTTLMAPLSFGSYKKLFKFRGGAKKKYFESLRRALFLFNSLILGIGFIILNKLNYIETNEAIFIYIFVLTEHVIHDESRVILYTGNRERWAKQNFIRTLFIITIPLILYFSRGEYLVIVIFILFFINIMHSRKNEGLFFDLSKSSKLIFRLNFFKKYFSQLSYFSSSVTGKISQQSDKYIFSIISFETLWVYTLVAQIASISLMYFEMTYISKLKASIAEKTTHNFRLLEAHEFRSLLVVSLACIIIFIIITYYIAPLGSYEFIVLFVILLIFNFLGAVSMINSEKMFWHISNPRAYLAIEIKAFILGHLLTVPIVLIFEALLLIKTPTIFTMAIKVWSAKKCLKS